MMDEPKKPEMPVEFKGKREAEIWERLLLSKPRIYNSKRERFAAAVRAFADEERAREEMQSAMNGGDVNSAKTYAAIARDMRGQADRLLAEA